MSYTAKQLEELEKQKRNYDFSSYNPEKFTNYKDSIQEEQLQYSPEQIEELKRAGRWHGWENRPLTDQELIDYDEWEKENATYGEGGEKYKEYQEEIKRASRYSPEQIEEMKRKGQWHAPYTYMDRAKQLAEGFAQGAGRTVDTYKKYVEAPINSVVGLGTKVIGHVGNSDMLFKAGSELMDSADRIYKNDTRYEKAFQKPFETEGTDETKEILKATGKGFEDGLEWSAATIATGATNNLVNGPFHKVGDELVKVVGYTSKGKLAPLSKPWLNNINDFLQYGYQGMPKMASTFGLGEGLRKISENQDDGDLMQFTKGMASYVLAGVTVDKLEKPFVMATKAASETVLDVAKYLSDPSNLKFNKLTEKIPSLKEMVTKAKEIYKMPREVAYNYIISRAERAKLDNDAIKSFDELNIPKSALTIYTEDYTRPAAVANYLPSMVYADYLKNVREKFIDSLNIKFEKTFGKIENIGNEDVITRTLAKNIVDSPHGDKIPPPTLSSEKARSAQNIKSNTNFQYDFDDNLVTNIVGSVEKDNISNSTKSVTNHMEKILEQYKNKKNELYLKRDSAISDSDYVDPRYIFNIAQKLEKEFDVAASSGTSIGNVFNVAKDIKNKIKIEDDFINNFFKNVYKQEYQGSEILQYLNPQYIFKLKEAINEHVKRGYIQGNQKKILTQLTEACDDSISLGIQKGTIKNPDLLKYSIAADDFYKNEYQSLIKLDVIKSLQKKELPNWVFNQLDNPEKVLEIQNIFNKAEPSARKNSQKLFENLKRLKVQDIFAKEFGYSEHNAENLSYEKIYNLFNDKNKELKLKALLPEGSYEKLKEDITNIGVNLQYMEKLSKNPIYDKGVDGVDFIIDKIKTRKGVNEIIKHINEDFYTEYGSEYAKKVIANVKKLSAYETILKEVRENSPNVRANIIYEKVGDNLRQSDLLVYLLGGMDKYKEFRKDLLVVADKMNDIYRQDASKGGAMIIKQFGSAADNLLYSLKSQIPYAIGGYQAKGFWGAVSLVLGKEWIARSLANAATDEKMVDKLIKASKKKDKGITFGKILLQSAKELVDKTKQAQYIKPYFLETTDKFNNDHNYHYEKIKEGFQKTW